VTLLVAATLVVTACTNAEPSADEEISANPPAIESDASDTVPVEDEDPGESDAPDADGSTESHQEYVHPDDWEQAHAQCMRDQGFAARVHEDGGVTYEDVPEAQGDALLAADDLCLELVQVEPRYSDSMDESQLRWLYAWYIEESIPCLQAAGYSGFEPPSEDTFVATYYTDESWAPYVDLLDAGGDPGNVLREAEASCPQSPDADALADQRASD
jgi:hypothetical protein